MNTLNQSMISGGGGRPVFVSRESDARFADGLQSCLKATHQQSSTVTFKSTADHSSTPRARKQEPLVCMETDKATVSDVVEFQPLTPLSFLHNSLLLEEKLSTSTRDESTRDDDDDDDDRSSSMPANVQLYVAVSSAVKLDAKQLRLIAKKMQRITGFPTVRIQNTVDPSLIAGFVVSYGNDESHTIDLSVKGQLAVLAARAESLDRTAILNCHQER